MARKRFVWGKWREVLESGVIGAPCPEPSQAEQELAEAQERASGLVLQPLVLKGGTKCPCCGALLGFIENSRCLRCKNDFYAEVEAREGEPAPAPVEVFEPKRPPPGTREYRVITQRDEFFGGKFDPMKLQGLMNREAASGWRVVSVAAADVSTFWGSFWTGRGARQELVIVMERVY